MFLLSTCSSDIKGGPPPKFQAVTKNMNMQKEERKIVKSINGIIIAVVNAIAMLVCLVGAVYYMYLYSCSASNPFTFSVLNMMHSVGFTASILLQLNNADDRVFVYLALGCYALACLPCLYIVLRALIQPTFVAGHPEKIVNNIILPLNTNSFL